MRPRDEDHLYRCAECGQVLLNGEACCQPAPFHLDAERAANERYREWRVQKAREQGAVIYGEEASDDER